MVVILFERDTEGWIEFEYGSIIRSLEQIIPVSMVLRGSQDSHIVVARVDDIALPLPYIKMELEIP